MAGKEIRFFLQSRLNNAALRLLNGRSAGRLAPSAGTSALSGAARLSDLLIGKTNGERETAIERYLEERGFPVVRHRFRSFEGEGQNFGVEIGQGNRIVILAAHHDAVPGSPGANDNAAAVSILLHLLERLEGRLPSNLRVRILFTAAEELFCLGARSYVRESSLDGVVGVLSLELCGIGDSVVIWDAPTPSPFLQSACGSLEDLGLRRDETYHVVGRIPFFVSDHRPFSEAAIPAYGFSVVPSTEVETLRRFVFNPVRNALVHLVKRPPRPFDTYHSRGDTVDTLEPGACDAVVEALESIVGSLSRAT